MCSSARATVSRASRWSVVSRATPSIRVGRAVVARLHPASRLDPADRAVREHHAVLGRVVEQASRAAWTVASTPGRSSGCSDRPERAHPVVERLRGRCRRAGGAGVELEVVGPHVPVEPAQAAGRHDEVDAAVAGTRLGVRGRLPAPSVNRHAPPRSRTTPQSDTLTGMSSRGPCRAAGHRRRPRRRRRTGHRLLHRAPGRRPSRRSRSPSAPRVTAARRCDLAFNEDHIAATSQAICEHRGAAGIAGPLFLGRDTHGLSEPAWSTALEVFAANDVTVLVDDRDRWTPTPAVSHAILRHNRGRATDDRDRADGVVVTPSHNPPRDGGFKYNPPDGGPAGSDITGWVQDRANEILRDGLKRRTAGAAGAGPRGRRRRRRTTTSGRTSTTCPSVARPRRGPRTRASGSAPTRWAVRASTTGRRSPNGTGST